MVVRRNSWGPRGDSKPWKAIACLMGRICSRIRDNVSRSSDFVDRSVVNTTTSERKFHRFCGLLDITHDLASLCVLGQGLTNFITGLGSTNGPLAHLAGVGVCIGARHCSRGEAEFPPIYQVRTFGSLMASRVGAVDCMDQCHWSMRWGHLHLGLVPMPPFYPVI